MDENIINDEINGSEADNGAVDNETYKEETKKCRYCGREMNTNFDFCIYCGKNQSDIRIPVRVEAEKKKAAPVIRVKKKKTSQIVYLALSIASFSIAFIFFVSGMLSWLGAGAITAGSVFGNIFGSTDVSVYIVSLINVTASLLSSVIFVLAGFVLLYLKNK